MNLYGFMAVVCLAVGMPYLAVPLAFLAFIADGADQ